MSRLPRPAVRVWSDDAPVQPGWADPTSSTDAASGPAESAGGGPDRTPPPWVWYVLAVTVLALLAGELWLGGGLERRTDVRVEVATGALVTTGPYELRLTSATAQQRTDTRGQVTWRVAVQGEGRTTGDQSLAPATGDDGPFAARDPRSGEAQPSSGLEFRDGLAQFGGTFTPGLPPQPFTVLFDFGPGFQPGADLLVSVVELEFRDSSLLGNQEPGWRNGDRAFRSTVPLTVLPPQTS